MTKRREVTIGLALMALLIAFSIVGQTHDVTRTWCIGVSLAAEAFFVIAGIAFIVRWLIRR